MATSRNVRLYETAQFYKDKKFPVHITFLKAKGQWANWVNGIILSVNEDFKDRLVLQEEKYGEMLIFFDRIMDDGIKPREEKR